MSEGWEREQDGLSKVWRSMTTRASGCASTCCGVLRVTSWCKRHLFLEECGRDGTYEGDDIIACDNLYPHRVAQDDENDSESAADVNSGCGAEVAQYMEAKLEYVKGG